MTTTRITVTVNGARYERSIDYARPLDPPLGPEESAWLQQQLRARQGQT